MIIRKGEKSKKISWPISSTGFRAGPAGPRALGPIDKRGLMHQNIDELHGAISFSKPRKFKTNKASQYNLAGNHTNTSSFSICFLKLINICCYCFLQKILASFQKFYLVLQSELLPITVK